MATDDPRPTFLTDVRLTLTREHAEKLYEIVGTLPLHDGWSNPLYVQLADALGETLPEWLREWTRERATA